VSDEKDFLSRWSRRKQAATADANRAKDEAPAKPATEQANVEPEKKADKPSASSSAVRDADVNKPFDLATLPSLDSITAITDVRDFLRAGVPPELTRAALRRVWSADPAIRDFIGLAENSWDFTAPDAIPGFGPLNASPEEIRQLVDQIMSRTTELAEAPDTETGQPPKSVATVPSQPQVPAQSAPSTAKVKAQAMSDLHEGVLSDQRPLDVAMQNDASHDEPPSAPRTALDDADGNDPPRPRRSRGGALPR
jgi:hypothetical protein